MISIDLNNPEATVEYRKSKRGQIWSINGSFFYRIVNSLGFPDPIHVTLVHLPMGLIIGAFCFAWISALSSWEKPAVIDYHCIGLAFLFLFPVIIFGFLDWRHF